MDLFSSQFTKNLTIKSPIQYSGGKHFARKILGDFIPFGVKEIVSPFFGGGSFELYLTKRGVKVKGFDLFEPLVNFWNVIQDDSVLLYNTVKENINKFTKEDYQNMQEGGFDKLTNSLEKAAMFYLLQCLSYNSRGFRGKAIRNFQVTDGELAHPDGTKCWGNIANPEELKDFYNPFVSVNLLDFRNSLTQYDTLFAYCDPPYPEVSGIYGDSEYYHEKFDHQGLKDILDSRNGDWLLSYNNCDTVHSLYPSHKYDVFFPDWKQGSRASGRGNEVLIKPK